MRQQVFQAMAGMIDFAEGTPTEFTPSRFFSAGWILAFFLYLLGLFEIIIKASSRMDSRDLLFYWIDVSKVDLVLLWTRMISYLHCWLMEAK
jgi:hypothetical protein